jgi:chromatin assembly factor 1 subunit A
MSNTSTGSPPPVGSPDSLTDASSNPADRNSPSPNPTPKTSPANMESKPGAVSASSTSQSAPPAKRKRVTAAEKQAAAEEKAKVREEKAKKKADSDALQFQLKDLKAKEREEKKLKKEEEDRERAQKREEREEKRRQKEESDRVRAQEREEKKRKKDEEDRRAQEEKDKKARSQLKLNSFFTAPATPKKPVGIIPPSVVVSDSPTKASPASGSSNQLQPKSEYEKIFKPFFVKQHVKLAPRSPMIDEETREAKSRILDEYISGNRGADLAVMPFSPTTALQLIAKPRPRGRLYQSVKQTMWRMQKDVEKCEKAGIDRQQELFSHTKVQLRKVPMKLITFQQDVRPPYYGTLSSLPISEKQAMRSVGRRPTQRVMKHLNYDYDSECEWQEEEGEDIDAMDDEEEDLDGEDDMDDFLDDSEDLGPARRLFVNSMEPESTGICWENERRRNAKQTMNKHRMEIILRK